jgi:hypothetical protein
VQESVPYERKCFNGAIFIKQIKLENEQASVRGSYVPWANSATLFVVNWTY